MERSTIDHPMTWNVLFNYSKRGGNHRTRSPIAVLVCMILLAGIPYTLHGQELQCSVSVDDRRLGTQSLEIADLGSSMARYINENRWTQLSFTPHERIGCRIQVILTGVDAMGTYQAEVIIQPSRPVFETTRETSPVILIDNDWSFRYERNQSLIRDDLRFDELTSFIDFYVYLILGFDSDTFSPLGGSRYFEQAMQILEIAQTVGAEGWGPGFGNQRNRYRLVHDLINPLYEEFREGLYRYHRLGLDQFSSDAGTAWREVMAAIETIRENRDRTGRSYLYDLFFDTKYREITAFFESAPASVRLRAYNLLRETDPGHSTEYERLR